MKKYLSIASFFGVFVALFLVLPQSILAVSLDTNSPTIEISPYSVASSLNWAGYYSTASSFNGVQGTFTVPSVATANSTSGNATWLGIGGVKSHDLIQAGVLTMTDSTGAISYEAWYETLPQVAQMVPLTIDAGDSITVSIEETTTNVWQITIVDNTTGKNYSTTVNYTSSHSSAEWIEEMPSDQDGFIPLDTFTATSFSNLGVSESGQNLGASSIQVSPITMTNSENQIIASPSSLSGNSFSVSRTSAASDQDSDSSIGRFQGFHRHRVYQSQGSNTGTTTTRVYQVSGQNAEQIIQQIQQLISQQFPGYSISLQIGGNQAQFTRVKTLAAHVLRNFFGN